MLEPAILPAQRPSRQQFSQVNRLCFVWNPADIFPEMRTDYLSLRRRKSMVAGVDIERLRGYSSSRSPERQ
jgi:hypothetical protein